MATVITEECINCGACEPECPNTAIYQGGVEYDWQDAKHPAVSDDFFYIVPEKCTECVGFFDQEACAAVCPVDCCIPDPARPESEELLFERAKQLHPGESFPEDFPSRFKEGGGAEKPASAANGEAAAAAAPAPVAKAAAPAPPAAAKAAAPGTARVEKIVAKAAKLDHGDPTVNFEGELADNFNTLNDAIRGSGREGKSTRLGFALLALAPGLGALGHEAKRSLERFYGDRRFFSSEMATALNVLQNFLLYPMVFYLYGLSRGLVPFTEGDKTYFFFGIAVATVETIWRLRESLFGGVPVGQARLGPSFYGAPLGVLLSPLFSKIGRGDDSGVVPVEGFFSPEFEAKRERERRYGDVYSVEEFDGGYHIRFELPRTVPQSSAKREMGIPDEMPDYDVNVVLNGNNLVVSGSVVDAKLRAVCGVSSAFPADFRTEIPLSAEVRGFRHRYANKDLEIVITKAES